MALRVEARQTYFESLLNKFYCFSDRGHLGVIQSTEERKYQNDVVGVAVVLQHLQKRKAMV